MAKQMQTTEKGQVAGRLNGPFSNLPVGPATAVAVEVAIKARVIVAVAFQARVIVAADPGRGKRGRELQQSPPTLTT